MPIYEYRCKDCGHYLDVLQKVSDDPLKKCPECGELEGLKRLISAPAFRLKGGGWYETDFKSDKEKRRNLAEGSGDASASGNGSGGGESSSSTDSGGSKSSEGASKSSEGAAKSGDGTGGSSSSGTQRKAAV